MICLYLQGNRLWTPLFPVSETTRGPTIPMRILALLFTVNSLLVGVILIQHIRLWKGSQTIIKINACIRMRGSKRLQNLYLLTQCLNTYYRLTTHWQNKSMQLWLMLKTCVQIWLKCASFRLQWAKTSLTCFWKSRFKVELWMETCFGTPMHTSEKRVFRL